MNDLISRKELLAEYDRVHIGEPGKARKLIEDAPAVSEWIPVSERLPEQGQEVIVYSGGVLKPTVFASQFWNKHYDSWARITHWMPLPEPPKGV